MKKILIVEDDYISQVLLKKILTEHGQCDIVNDGLKAIDAVVAAANSKHPYDLICLDIMIPKIDGVKVLKAVREFESSQNIEKSKQVKIFMTTALGKTSLVQDAINSGCDEYLPKPIDIFEFNKKLEKYGC